jgi:glutathione synthase/RimK-type ligase-like ATP-grasp enzyme
MVAAELEALGARYVVFNQRRFAESGLDYEIVDGQVGGLLRTGAGTHPLPEIRGVYVRLMDDRHLPEVSGLAPDAPERAVCRALNDALVRWLELTPARVINRSGPQASNGSKPYQAQLIARAGLRVPETLVTTDPEAVIDFRARHGRLVYKSISGVRSIVRELGDDDLARLDAIRWCPTQFQAYVEGTDVRAHCIGGEVFATAIHATATDYRYARHDGEVAELEAIELPDELAERCVRLTADLGLEFSGLDLRVGPDGGEPWCFEANPSPAFSYYEDGAGQPIARAIARRLAAA